MLSEKEPRSLIEETFNVLQKPLKDLSITQEIPPELTATLEENVFVFSGFKTYHELKEASMMLKDETGGFKSFERFSRDVESIDKKYNKNYLAAEYEFAVSSSQMAVRWKDLEKDGDRYDLQYRTAGDDRVREEHAALNGITLPPSDKFWNEYYPPNGWRCRCTAVQVRKDKYPESDSDEAVKAGEKATTQIGKNGTNKSKIFRFNPGKQEKIFPPKHPYYKTPEADLIRSKTHRNNVFQGLLKDLKSKNIEFREVAKLQTIPDEAEIIKKISGADLTDGSCSSLAFAYAGNKLKFDVTDFRGGDSCKFFCDNRNITKIVEKAGGSVVKNKNDFRAAVALLKQVEEGKEYYFTTGQHATIVTKDKSGFKYLELQSAEDNDNGWHTLTTEKLKRRFKAQKSHSTHGLEYEATSHLIEIEKLGKCDDFKDLLGYINTSTSEQQKGAGGGIK